MTVFDIAAYRLHNHQISAPNFTTPAEVTSWLGAVQAQDYAHSKWAVGQRLPGSTDAGIDQALNDKQIIRTWALRGTLHLLATPDVRWILGLIAPGMIARTAAYYKKFDLDKDNFPKITEAIVQILQGGKQLTREDLFAQLEQRGIATQDLRGSHILYRAALERTICLGPFAGKQPTYTLLDEWAPDFPVKPYEEALAEFTLRYFNSHGPATVSDFCNWSGFTQTEAKKGLELVKSSLVHANVEGQVYWMPENGVVPTNGLSKVYLLAGFDEYLLGYKDRSIILDAAHQKEVVSFNGIFKPTIIIEGRVAGIWSRSFKKNEVLIETKPYFQWDEAHQTAIEAEAARYARFMGKTAAIIQNPVL